MWQPFAERARKAIIVAQEVAQKQRNPFVDTDHLLLGIVSGADGALEKLLAKYGIFLEAVRKNLTLPSPETVAGWDRCNMLFSEQLKHMLEKVFEISRSFNVNFISTFHLLSAITQATESSGYQILRKIVPSDKDFEEFVGELKQLTEQEASGVVPVKKTRQRRRGSDLI